MPRALSLHIGVNHPSDRLADRPLQYSELTAWRMAELASRAGYDALQVLRGPAATRAAVHQALSAAAGTLGSGDTMLLSFSGHGTQRPDMDDERDRTDEAWCLYDGLLLDDALLGYWCLFERGVRIVVVAESCHAGGMVRTHDEQWVPSDPGAVRWRGAPGPMRGPSAEPEPAAACLVYPPRHHDGIRASVLLLTATGEDQLAHDGLFTRYLLDLWDDGAFRGSYTELYSRVRQRVMSETCAQEPRIALLGAADPEFAQSPAFHLERGPGVRRGRGGTRMAG